ncbi:MAG TPA: TIM-barrel domain-containing protein [Verrucomicrobiae bacterium]|nr:TIM-barrel domain-containing protein [Verrucomicrobiae bacterium]
MKVPKPVVGFFSSSVCLLLLGLVCLPGLNPVHAQENVETNRHGLLVRFGQARVELAAATPDALRLSVAYDEPPRFIPTSFLADLHDADSVAWQVIKKHGMIGIRTQAGELLINPRTGEWTLRNAAGEVLIPRHEIGGLNQATSPENTNILIRVGWDRHQPISVYGCGNGVGALQQSNTATGLSNGRAVLPYYWSAAGYAVLAVTANDNQPACWQAAANGEYLTWTFPGREAELYLMPAASLKDAAEADARLTGLAPVPPRWTFGYLQSRWGWKNRAYIEDTLQQFRDLKIPVDAFIYDFEWYTTNPDYKLPADGVAGFADFGCNTNLFPDPAGQIQAYKNQGVHFVGIRKPRLGNRDTLAMIRAKGWNLQIENDEKYHLRDVNFGNPEFREWYIGQSAGLLSAGIDGWWNDEGESTFTTYYYWNLAEAGALARYRPGQRLWTLNRAFSPGLQRLGAAAWTGDIHSSWKALAETPTSLLNWSLAGMPYETCDIGGFSGNPSPELLSRWMEAGVFFPIMRSHSEISATPRFPWLYGPDALAAIRQAIELRYRLIPFYYSLAHETFQTGVPLMRPLLMEFPDDPKTADLSDQWMMGGSLMAAPILQPGGKRSVYLPAGRWFAFGSNLPLKGKRAFEVTAGLDEIPLYVRAGSILPLGPVIQHTGQLPGGPLELQIYPGRDATFTLFEDDGETTDYLKGQVRRTTFTWRDKTGRLIWQSEGPYAGRDVFQSLHVVLFDPRKKIETQCILNAGGTLDLRQ